MTPLEAAARALCICAGDDPDRITNPQDRNRDSGVVQSVAVESWMNYRKEARAAISAYLKACAEDEAIEAPAKAMWEMHADEPLQVGKWKEPTDYREFKHLSDSARAKIIGLARACIAALEPKE